MQNQLKISLFIPFHGFITHESALQVCCCCFFVHSMMMIMMTAHHSVNKLMSKGLKIIIIITTIDRNYDIQKKAFQGAFVGGLSIDLGEKEGGVGLYI